MKSRSEIFIISKFNSNNIFLPLLETIAIRNAKSLKCHQNRVEEFFEMDCELCGFQFTSLQHAKLHYFNQHEISDGYLKCSCTDIKFKTNNSIYDHIEFHLGNSPDRYKYEKYV